jgi:hypothetical protein
MQTVLLNSIGYGTSGGGMNVLLNGNASNNQSSRLHTNYGKDRNSMLTT